MPASCVHELARLGLITGDVGHLVSGSGYFSCQTDHLRETTHFTSRRGGLLFSFSTLASGPS